MRVMVFVKASKDTEAGVLPTRQMWEEMDQFNEELVKAGIALVGEGLMPSSTGVRVRFSGKDRIVTDGPFAETAERTDRAELCPRVRDRRRTALLVARAGERDQTLCDHGRGAQPGLDPAQAVRHGHAERLAEGGRLVRLDAFGDLLAVGALTTVLHRGAAASYCGRHAGAAGWHTRPPVVPPACPANAAARAGRAPECTSANPAPPPGPACPPHDSLCPPFDTLLFGRFLS